LIRIAYIALRIACVECCLPYGDSTSKMFWLIATEDYRQKTEFPPSQAQATACGDKIAVFLMRVGGVELDYKT